MKAVIHFHPEAQHQREHAVAMRAGLERHGVIVAYGGYNCPSVREHDFVVIWGSPTKQPLVCRESPHVLVMERGHLPDRMQYTSCGWDGLGRRGRYPTAPDGERWSRLWGQLMQPWRDADGYALLIGQVEGDAALAGKRVRPWVDEQTRALRALGWAVRFRPHPLTERPARSLDDDLTGAGLCVTYNSTTGVEAVLAGVPTITLDEGAMAWDVAGHSLGEVARPDRTSWAHDLAWTSWSVEEISSGAAWEHLAPLMEAPCATV